MEQDEAIEAAKKAAVRSHRVRQFFWGWFWFATIDVGTKLVGLAQTDASPWALLPFFALFAALALYYQKKVLAVGFSCSSTKK